MKKINKLLMTLFCMSLTFCVAACGGANEESEKPMSSVEVSSEETSSEEGSVSSEEEFSSEEASSSEEESSSETSSESSDEGTETTFTVTFKQNGFEDKVFTVNEGEAFTNIPATETKTGYTVTWEEIDLSAITANVTVNAVETANSYEITFDAKNGSEVQVEEFEYDAAYTLPADPSVEGYAFAGWYYNGVKVESEVWNIAENATIVAAWENAIEEGEYAAKFFVDYINYGEHVTASFVTKESYAAGSTVSFKYYLPSDVTSSWFAVCGVADPADTCIYTDWLYQGSLVKDTWTTISVTLESDSYIHFAGAALEWGNGTGYVLIDDFTVTTGDTTVKDTFNTGATTGLFNVNDPMAVALGEGYFEPPFEEGEYAVKLDFSENLGDESKSFITKEAVAKAGDCISISYYIPETTTTGDWWALCWDTNGDAPYFWAPAYGVTNMDEQGNPTTSGGLFLKKDKGVWITEKVTLPESDSDYYLYIIGYSSETNTQWSGVVYVDDIKINDTTEDFNKPLNDSIFSCNSYVSLSGKGEGYVAPVFEEGEYAMKLMLTTHEGKVPFYTKNSYAAGSTISFKYYIPAGTTTNWWRFSYGQNVSGLDYYDSDYNSLTAVVGQWTEVTVTLPGPGAPYYFFFGNEEGNWKLNGGTAYLLIDDIAVNGEIVEDFNKPLDEWIFEVVDNKAIALSEKGEGYVAGQEPEGPSFEEGEYAAKIIVDRLKSDAGAASFITKESYTAGSTISFKYYLPSNVTSAWFAVCAVADPEVTSIYENWIGGNAVTLTKDAWNTVTLTLETDAYIHFAAAVGDWGAKDNPATEGYILIDDFTVTTGETIVTDTFNTGLTNGLFNVNTPNAIELADGYVAPSAIEDGMLTFSAAAIGGNENIAMITDVAYSGVTEITFKAIWTGDAKSSRWGLSYTTDPTKFKYDGDTIGIDYINCYTPRLGELKMDAGVEYTYKFTFENGEWKLYVNNEQIASGAYTDGENYFYIMVCPAVEGEGDIFYMEDFTIKTASATIIDTFEGGESTVFVNSATKNSNYGSTGMDFEESVFTKS